jgi:hypothetical protein
MGHDIYTRLYIGGRITAALAAEIGQLIDDVFYELQHQGEDQDDPASAFDYHASTKEPAEFLGMTNFGMATRVCDFLAEHEIAYRREADADSEGDAEGTIYDPQHDPRAIEIDSGGNPIASLQWLKDEAEAGRTLADVIASLTADEWMPPAVVLVDDEAEGAANG